MKVLRIPTHILCAHVEGFVTASKMATKDNLNFLLMPFHVLFYKKQRLSKILSTTGIIALCRKCWPIGKHYVIRAFLTKSHIIPSWLQVSLFDAGVFNYTINFPISSLSAL